MKLRLGMAALVMTALGTSWPAANASSTVSHTAVVVTTADDDVNGNVSSIAALNANPGRDGISLREAITAANATPGSSTIYIMFSHALNGKTIQLRTGGYPPIHRSHLVLEGIDPTGSAARVTIDGQYAPGALTFGLLLVEASDVTIRWLRFTGVPGNPTGQATGVIVRAGPGPGSGPLPVPRSVSNVQIEDNSFDNIWGNSRAPGGTTSNGLVIENGGGSEGADTTISNVTVEGNTFLDYASNSDGVGVWADASGMSIRGVTIEDNTFHNDQYSIELSEGNTKPSESNIQILDNTITGGVANAIGISLNATDAIDATRSGTVIDDNTFSGVQGAAINVDAEVFSPDMHGFPDSSYGDVISNTQIINDLISGGTGTNPGLYFEAGDQSGTTASAISGVTIENDTLVTDGTSNLLSETPNGEGVIGNQIGGVILRNDILYAPNATPINQGGPVPEQSPNVVMNSLISGPSWAGTNGNITGDPEFVDPVAGNYHLAAGSPCIGAGTALGAPAYDLDGSRRASPPAIGAYEYGAAPRPLLSITVQLLGGTGMVVSNPAGINCGSTCSDRFALHSRVSLSATPGAGSRFVSWLGACRGTRSCTVTLNGTSSVTARFDPT